MRVALPAILVILICGVVAALFVYGEEVTVEGVLEPEAPSFEVGEAGQLVLVRKQVPENGTPPPAAIPRIRYRLIDREGRPIPGGRIVRARDGATLGTTDAAGEAVVEGGPINAVVFAAPGHLLEHFFDRPDAARDLVNALRRDGFVTVRLRRDDLTIATRFEFRAVDGSPARDVVFRFDDFEPFRVATVVPTVRMGAGASIPPELRDAWKRHVMLATIREPRFTDECLHFGAASANATYHCANGAVTVRFVADSLMAVRARAGDEFRSQRFELPAERVTVQLRKGGFVRGQVIDQAGRRPIAQAAVTLTRPRGILASDVTDAEGHFTLGPVADEKMQLTVHHPAYRDLEIRRVRPDPDPAPMLVELRAVAKATVRGVVRQRPALTPVAGAKVRLQNADGVAAATTTDAAGRFEVKSHLLDPEVVIVAAGCLEYAESLNANGEERRFDLLPASVAARLQGKLTGLVHGTVLDEKGQPAVDRPVHIRPIDPQPPRAFDGRRILRGGRLLDPTRVITDEKGVFSFEWPRAESIRVHAVLGISRPEDGSVVQVVLGGRHALQLRDPKR